MLPMLDTNVWGYYNKLAAFIPNAKGVWDFLPGWFKNFYRLYRMRWNALRLCLTLSIAIFQRFLHNKTLSLPQKSQKA
ncbi:hypothetical protein HpVH110_01010 [Helicobacter pylori]